MLLAALVGSGAGSADGVVVAAAGRVAGVVGAVSFFRVSAAGAVTISDGLVFAASGTVAVVSSLKSLMVGGGRLAGSGRGIAASIASSAALRAGSAWPSAEVADTVRKVPPPISQNHTPEPQPPIHLASPLLLSKQLTSPH